MPYIVCVNVPGCLPEQDPTAVATIEAARDLAATEIEGSPAWIGTEYVTNNCAALTAEAERLPDEGGVIGPMPDGYVIDVRRVGWSELDDMSGAEILRKQGVRFPDDEITCQAILDAYNGGGS